MKKKKNKSEDKEELAIKKASTRQESLSNYMEENHDIGNERNVILRDLVDLPSTTYGTFGLYRYPAKFIPHVVAYILENYSDSSDTVFDPFAGYGTVGVVAQIYGNDYELWDLNPILNTLHSITQLRPKKVNVDEIISNIKLSKDEFIPDWSNFEYWFSNEFIKLFTRAWGFYHSLNDNYLRLLLTIPLLKVCRHFSFDDPERMKLSKSPKSTRRVMDLLEDDWKTKFYSMLQTEIEKLIKGLKENQSLKPKKVNYQIKSGIDTLTTSLSEEKDILITSPPYLQSQEYIRHAKMDLFWLGYKEKDVKKLSKLEIPYRDVEEFSIESEAFSSIRDEIQEDHIKKVYNRYFWAVTSALDRLSTNIRSHMFLFVGRSSLRGKQIPIDQIFAEHFSNRGWVHDATLVDTIVSRRMFSYRVNPATNIVDSRTSTEHLVVLRRP